VGARWLLCMKGGSGTPAQGDMTGNCDVHTHAGAHTPRHVAQMLRNSSLEQLLGEHRTSAKEIKNLESDIQQLVYENYSKFISATNTIRAMKARVDEAMPELHHLKSTMGRWAAVCTRVCLQAAASVHGGDVHLHGVGQAAVRPADEVLDARKLWVAGHSRWCGCLCA